MPRSFRLVAIVAGVLVPATGAWAAVTPPGAPELTSPALASPVTIHWTPGVESTAPARGHGHGHGQGGDVAPTLTQDVLRSPGSCATPAGDDQTIATFADDTTSDYSDAVPDGTYCYSIRVSDGSTTADSPGLTVGVETLPAPVATAGTAVGLTGNGVAVVPTIGVAPADTLAPPAPTGLSVLVPRSRHRASRIRVAVRWANPVAVDLAQVVLVVNVEHAPGGPLDGRVVYRGPGTSALVTLRPGQTGFLALFAYDGSGNASPPARRVVSLASLVPLRPLTGSIVGSAPLLSWAPTRGATYYNVQVFLRGRRVLTAWPSHPSFRIPEDKLQPGTYVWFVWPAFTARRATSRFADLIGRATFVFTRDRSSG